MAVCITRIMLEHLSDRASMKRRRKRRERKKGGGRRKKKGEKRGGKRMRKKCFTMNRTQDLRVVGHSL